MHRWMVRTGAVGATAAYSLFYLSLRAVTAYEKRISFFVSNEILNLCEKVPINFCAWK